MRYTEEQIKEIKDDFNRSMNDRECIFCKVYKPVHNYDYEAYNLPGIAFKICLDCEVKKGSHNE
ncbi:hypothetical protein UFOVP9_56 [uncultured Caudovirales phage]|jgi:hypothetical protein|uniref:Uncharacterized protein n=1 Tax=uncultured Caudovirales phage TaxID=2100421 RepID=A0A6J5KIF4_9CAUD|nr:hypothetical protein UFOVP9_56 [uncultured Caudovirales phage]